MATALLLALVVVPAHALGLGQIKVKSRAGQPLLAEIPIISNDPSELQGLQAQLASPDTFRRIGLEPPQGAASQLQFELAMDEGGRPIIRVTTPAPVEQPMLTFLVEVNWGQGRLVREYSALVATPTAVAAPVQPAIQAPVVAPPNTVARAPVVPAEPPAQREPPPVAPAPSAAPTPPEAIVRQPAPVVAPPSAAPATAPTPAPAVAAPELGPVKPGQTLSQIAGGLGGETTGYSLDQTMLALLRSNPDAFIGNDINRLKQGAVLRMPGKDELSRYSSSQAAAMVREQVAQWRQARRPQAQPAALANAQAQPRQGAAQAQRQVAGARLEIVPPSASAAKRAGTQSGMSAGGEGDMLRQELNQTKETLAARDQEVVELKARIAELEKLQQQQQQLLAMKDSKLASAEQVLAKANQAASAPPAAPATATASQPPSAARVDETSFAWWWGVPVVVLLAALGWWWSRRRAAAPVSRKPFDAKTLAAAVPEAEPAQVPKPSPDAFSTPEVVVEPAPVPASVQAPKAPEVADVPLWSVSTPPKETRRGPAHVPAAPRTAAPTWHAGGGETLVSLNPAPAGHERIELARAYIELGDRQTARSLLQEVVDGGDDEARDEASRVLRDMA